MRLLRALGAWLRDGYWLVAGVADELPSKAPAFVRVYAGSEGNREMRAFVGKLLRDRRIHFGTSRRELSGANRYEVTN